MRWPKEALACKHQYWGIVAIVDDVSVYLDTLEGQKEVITVFPAELHQNHSYYNYALRAWREHLSPLTPAAREMLKLVRR